MTARCRLIVCAALCAMLVAAACSSSPRRTSVPAEPDSLGGTGQDDLPEVTDSVEPLQPAEASPSTAGGTASGAQASPQAGSGATAAAGDDFIATAGLTGLRFLQPDGVEVAAFAEGLIVTQPTWSRDGRRLAATVIDPEGGGVSVAIVDVSTWGLTVSVARRPYFFYSWSHDGTRLAALGPGSSGGTSLDVLDDRGMPTSDHTLAGGSVYLAWEPGGRRLLLHTGSRLHLLEDPDDFDTSADLGPVGIAFQAPAWIPGTEDFLYVDSVAESADGDPRLVRRSASSDEVEDLGTAIGFIVMAVHPDGDRAALSRLLLRPPVSDSATDSLETAVLRVSTDPAVRAETAVSRVSTDPAVRAETAVSRVSTDPAVRAETAVSRVSTDPAVRAETAAPTLDGAVQIVDLVTGERRTVLDRSGFWLEWSPDGRRLLIAAPAPREPAPSTIEWHVWNGEESVQLDRFTPSAAFANSFLPFADQYNETPRLWSPDNEAITFGAIVDGLSVAAVTRLDNAGGVTSLGPAEASSWRPGTTSPALG